MEGYLKVIVLGVLSKKPMSGYALMKSIAETTGSWKPSAGSIYPLLNSLRNDGLVEFKQVKKQKIYSLTLAGKKRSRTTSKARESMIDSLMAKLSMCEQLPEDESAALLMELLKRMDKSKFPKGIVKGTTGIREEVLGMKKQMLRLHVQGKMIACQKEIKKILADASRKLGEL